MNPLPSPDDGPKGAVSMTERPVGRLARAKAGVRGGVLLVVEALGTAASAVGVPVAAFTGKLYLAVLLALFGLGCYLRFVRLRQRRQHIAVESAAPFKRVPAWLTPAIAAMSVIELAFLVEATRLPVRVDQPGFDTANWWWVIAGFILLFWLQRAWMIDRFHTARLRR